MSTDIELIFFATEPATVEAADRAGMDGFIVDWEDRCRFQRQHAASDTAPPDTAEDLECVASHARRPTWCRINQAGDWTRDEVELAITLGADVILLPMVRGPNEVATFLSLVAGRVQTGILVETVEACRCARQLAALPLDRVYTGLFDLSISRGHKDMFSPLTDGTVERLRNAFRNTSFGVAGLTTLDGGNPIPCLDLMGHLVRLGCDFTFLRNSFKRDLAGRNLQNELLRIRSAWAELAQSDTIT